MLENVHCRCQYADINAVWHPIDMKDVVDTSALIGYRLKRAQISLRSRMDEGLRPFGLTSPQYACLELIQRRPGASSAELARAAFVTRQTMSTLLKGLVARGLVERSERACAGRAMPTGLTAEGGDLLRRASAVVREVESRMISRLSDTQVEALGEALSRCAEALSAD